MGCINHACSCRILILFFLIDLRCRLVNACRISSTKTLNHRIILIFNVQSVNLHRLHPAHLDDTPRRSAPHRSHCALCMHNHPPLVGDTCLVLEDMGHQELTIPRHTVPVMKPSDASALLKMVIWKKSCGVLRSRQHMMINKKKLRHSTARSAGGPSTATEERRGDVWRSNAFCFRMNEFKL